MTLGDCWRKCVGRLADIEAERVPDFVNEDPEHWLGNTTHWLHLHGLDLVAMVPVLGAGSTIEVAELATPRPPYIAAGQSVKARAAERDTVHAVVFDADGQLWDPDEGGTGLASVVAMYWVVPHRRNS